MISTQSNGKHCALCAAISDSARAGDPFLHNRRLLQTDRFVVLPSVGPLVPGHVMVLSRLHCHSLASMGAAAIREYNELAAHLRAAPLLQGTDPLEAEHGSTSEDKAGACVIHTHVHWLPGMGRFCDELGKRLSARPEASLEEVGMAGGPYIFARAASSQRIFRALGLPSQTIRRILCEITDRDDTDWRQALRPDWVRETVNAWLGNEEPL